MKKRSSSKKKVSLKLISSPFRSHSFCGLRSPTIHPDRVHAAHGLLVGSFGVKPGEKKRCINLSVLFGALFFRWF